MNYKPFIHQLNSPHLKLNEPLSSHTYFKIGGPADLFFTAHTTQELIKVVRLAIKHQLPYFILGGGSNILFADEGFRGLVIKNKTDHLRLKGFSGGSVQQGQLSIKKVLIQTDSGVPANKLIRFTLDEGYAGLEDFLGLPGTVGGAIFNNSHHLGKLIGDLVVEVEVLDHQGQLKKYSHQEIQFAYDYSIFQKTKETILTATFQLSKGDKHTLWQKAEQAVKRRAQTQPLGSPSSGCFFKNISLADAVRLGTPNRTCSAGYLIDKAGLKGARVGGAVVSDKHANFIINTGQATAADVLSLAQLIQQKVKQKFGVDLKPEVFLVPSITSH